MTGFLAAIAIAPTAGAPMESVQQATVAAQGIEGDRYAAGEGTYSDRGPVGRAVTLIELETIEAIEREYALKVDPIQTRRNLVTNGVALAHLVERDFRIGSTVFRGIRPADPCFYLEQLVGQKGLLKSLVHRGGLRVDVVTPGEVQVGDEVELL